MNDYLPSRRRFLSGSLAIAMVSSGCLDAFGGSDGSKRAMGERPLKLELSRRDGPLRENFVVDLTETRPDWDEEAFEATLDGREYTTQYHTPFVSTPEDPRYTRRDGTYYRLGSVVVDEVTTTHPVLRLFEVGGTDDAPGSIDDTSGGGDDSPTTDGVALDELPEVDQRAARVAYFAARARDNEGGAPWGLIQRGGYVYRRDEATAESRLLSDDGPEHVTYRDQVYGVEITREQFHEPVYRATVEPVVGTPEQMESILRAQFVDARLSREDLSTEARDVVREARTGGYSEAHPYSPGYCEVLRALHRRAYLDGDIENDAGVDTGDRSMVRYDGAYYNYWLRFVSG